MERRYGLVVYKVPSSRKWDVGNILGIKLPNSPSIKYDQQTTFLSWLLVAPGDELGVNYDKILKIWPAALFFSFFFNILT